eukprot:scaffold895_cov315-Pinguiococcus_pyrenoidosus.AAC.7
MASEETPQAPQEVPVPRRTGAAADQHAQQSLLLRWDLAIGAGSGTQSSRASRAPGASHVLHLVDDSEDEPDYEESGGYTGPRCVLEDFTRCSESHLWKLMMSFYDRKVRRVEMPICRLRIRGRRCLCSLEFLVYRARTRGLKASCHTLSRATPSSAGRTQR